MAKPYNGHRSWNAWNVALWLYNDEGLYRFVKDTVKSAKSIHHAVRAILRGVGEKTPDGAKYNSLCVRLAIEDDWKEHRVKGV